MEKLCQQTLVFADITNHSDARPMLNRLKEVLPDALGLPDIILIDLHMPEFNGWDFLHFNALYDSLSKRVQVYESAG
ncbi:hypothetical protein [Mucilaginibacter terrae]|nr:hypothetical protein [Mucilaginibacter terrae]